MLKTTLYVYKISSLYLHYIKTFYKEHKYKFFIVLRKSKLNFSRVAFCKYWILKKLILCLLYLHSKILIYFSNTLLTSIKYQKL